MLSLFARQIERFRRDKRGNIVTLFALTLVPVLAVAGGAVDYSRADNIRSVGSVAKNSPAFIAAGSMSSDGPIPVGVTDATNIFSGNMAGQTGYTLNSMTASVTRSSGTVTSSVQFSATISTTFMAAVGKGSLTVTGGSTSVTSMPQYIDFYPSH
jgi:Flp pilus assembly protein TadG